MLPIELRARRDPRLILPVVPIDIEDDRGGIRTQLEIEPVGVRLHGEVVAVTRLDFKLVALARAQLRKEQLPDTGGAAHAHRVPAAVPSIEVADHADALRMRRPDGEMHP